MLGNRAVNTSEAANGQRGARLAIRPRFLAIDLANSRIPQVIVFRVAEVDLGIRAADAIVGGLIPFDVVNVSIAVAKAAAVRAAMSHGMLLLWACRVGRLSWPKPMGLA